MMSEEMAETASAPKQAASKWKWDAEGRVVVGLAYPISGATELNMRRLKVKDLRTANAQADDDLEVTVKLAVASSGLTLLQFDELDAMDWRNVVDVVNFLQRSSTK
jgi:hypothetical protein